MGYSLKAVPLEKLKSLARDLDELETPVDRQQALRVGACCILINSTANECIRNIPEEKRQLATWVRNQRSMVRFVRYKGSSRMRAAMNADISNASDSAKNLLLWVKDYASHAIEVADSRIRPCLEFANLDDINMYVATFQKELESQHSLEDAKNLMWGSLVTGALLLFILPPFGGILLICGLAVYLLNKDKWKKFSEAKIKREIQLKEIKNRDQQLTQFDKELNPAAQEEDREQLQKAIITITEQLQSQYSFLDVACRELGSDALSWEQLAREIHDDSATLDPGLLITQSDQPNSNHTGQSMKEIRNEATKTGEIYTFKITLDDAKSIMKNLGYKRLPREWLTISLTAEEKICKELAKNKGIEYENYFWSFDEGKITAELL